MPTTSRERRILQATPTIEQHMPQADGLTCHCGKTWTPRHVAVMLENAGALGWRHILIESQADADE